MSSSSPKRPSPPAPDPNWEDELHGPHGKPSRAAPDSKDELLAHAVLRIEPEPLDAIDDFGELDRVTLPPPTGMADHVARMMAEAAMLDDVEDFDNEGDRPTPLFELEPPPFPQRGVRQNEPTPRAPLPAMRDIPVRPLAPREPAPAPRGGPLRAPTPAPFRSPRGGPLRVPTPAPFATPLGGPLRSSTPEPFSAPPSSGPLRVPADEPFPSVRAREASGPPPSTRAPTPPQGRAPRASTTPIPGVPSRPTAQRPTTPAPPPPRARDRVPSSLDLEDLADLPAVLGFDGLDLDEPASDPTPRPRIAHMPVRPRARSVSSSSFAAPPISEPAISPPFASLDPAELAAELSGLVSASSSRSGSAAVASARVESTEVVSAPVESPRTEVVSAVDSMADGAAVGDASAGDVGAGADPDLLDDGWAEPSVPVPPETVAAIEARLEAGDYGRALMMAEAALVEHAGDPVVSGYASTCRDELYKRYLERLGAGDHVPRLAVNRGALTGLSLDHRAGFLLSCVDGGSTVEEIIDVSAMPRLDAVRILYELVQEGVLEMHPAR